MDTKDTGGKRRLNFNSQRTLEDHAVDMLKIAIPVALVLFAAKSLGIIDTESDKK